VIQSITRRCCALNRLPDRALTFPPPFPRQFRALSPEVPYVALLPWLLAPTGGDGAGAAIDAAAAAVPMAVPLFVHLTELDLTGSGVMSALAPLAVEKLQAAAPNLCLLRLDAVGTSGYGEGESGSSLSTTDTDITLRSLRPRG
jgi:hypothetical protein